MGAFSTWVYLNDWRLAFRRPSPLGGGLQIQAGFILSQNSCLRCVLDDVDQFFSISSSNCAAAISDLER